MTSTASAPGRSPAAPSTASIVVRQPTLALSSDLPIHWFDGNAFATHVLDALSSTFPEGEAFFVRSVLHFRDRIDDPELRAAVQAFAAQEGQHSRQHDRHLRILYQRYPALAARNRLMKRVLLWLNRVKPKASLAATAALEHLTTLLARKLMRDPEHWTSGPMDARIAPLWQWHALEEAEHKCVAFDVLQQVAPSRWLRAWMLALNSPGLFVEILDRTAYMLWKDGLLFRWQTWRQAAAFLFAGSGRGLLRGLGREYVAWFRTGFHPGNVDDSGLIEHWRAQLG